MTCVASCSHEQPGARRVYHYLAIQAPKISMVRLDPLPEGYLTVLFLIDKRHRRTRQQQSDAADGTA